jgi:hypothetical protein
MKKLLIIVFIFILFQVYSDEKYVNKFLNSYIKISKDYVTFNKMTQDNPVMQKYKIDGKYIICDGGIKILIIKVDKECFALVYMRGVLGFVFEKE